MALLVAAILAGGRFIRREVLLGPDGGWRPGVLEPAVLEAAGSVPRDRVPDPPRVLTDPLPINHCSEDSLTLLPRVGPVLAGRIAEARREGLVFRSAADLKRVKGIGPRLAALLDSLVDYGAQPGATGNPGKS
ncbi:MAG: helix-hairpin-helix domain-containing protein [bacterium]